MDIVLRAVKISIAATLAILLSDLLGLQYSTAAGVVAILSVLETRKSSIDVVKERILSTLLAFLIAVLCFRVFGYTILAFAIFLLIYVPSAFKLNVQAGLGPCSVVVSHLYLEQSTSMTWMANGFLLMVIGGGLALVFNVYSPSKSDEIFIAMQKIEETMRKLILSIKDSLESEKTKDNTPIYSKLKDTINSASELLRIEYENRDYSFCTLLQSYLNLRKSQISILRRIEELVDFMERPIEGKAELVDLLDNIGHSEFTYEEGKEFLEEVKKVLDQFRNTRLPESRAEFEDWAFIFSVLNYIKEFFMQTEEILGTYTKEDIINCSRGI